MVDLFKRRYMRQSKPVPVYQIDRKTESIIEEYESISEASRKTGANETSIHHVLNGVRNHAGGFKWERKND